MAAGRNAAEHNSHHVQLRVVASIPPTIIVKTYTRSHSWLLLRPPAQVTRVRQCQRVSLKAMPHPSRAHACMYNHNYMARAAPPMCWRGALVLAFSPHSPQGPRPYLPDTPGASPYIKKQDRLYREAGGGVIFFFQSPTKKEAVSLRCSLPIMAQRRKFPWCSWRSRFALGIPLVPGGLLRLYCNAG